MQSLDDYRTDFIREICELAEENHDHPANTFISVILERFRDTFGIKSQIDYCYINQLHGKKTMRLDAAAIDITTFEVNLFLADFDEKEKKVLSHKDIIHKVKLLCGFFYNALSGAYNHNIGSPEEIISASIRENIASINRLHLFIFTTGQISKSVKEYKLPPLPEYNIELKLDIVDIERLYNLEEGPEDFEINVAEHGISPIYCIKAPLDTNQYDAYLAIVPGNFLASIYKAYGAKLLKANVRSFLNMTGSVNKGIRDTIRKSPESFFAYNNGISTTAKDVTFEVVNGQLQIVSFKGLQIINGGQTTASLALATIKDKISLDKIFVQMKMTIVKETDKELIRNIARYANSQTKVTQTDLNSSHDFYVQLETLSRRIFAPVQSGAVKPTKWFFERVKKQYNQPTLTEAKTKAFRALYPSTQKFNIEDAAKFLNLAELKPFDVAWGAQENAKRFHKNIEEVWSNDQSFCNDWYFKELVGKNLFYKKIKSVVEKANWYKDKKGNLAQIVAYTFAMLVFNAQKIGKNVDFRSFWLEQSIPEVFSIDIFNAAKAIFDMFYNPNANITDVREFCKRLECWEETKKISFDFSIASRELLS